MSKSLDRLTLLSTFLRIAERGSIGAAARDLGMAQATASRQLAELEERVGVKLIHRTTHSLALTEIGETALTEARVLLDGWDALCEGLREDIDVLSGPLKIVAPVALGQLHLAEAVLRFQADHPGVAISWLLEDDPIRFAEIGCDLWIKIGRPGDDSLVVKEIATVERLIVATTEMIGKQRYTHPSKLSELPCAALGPFDGGLISLESAGGTNYSLKADVALSTNNIFMTHRAALMGIGYAVLPRWFVESDLIEGRLVDVLPRWRAASLTITASFLPARRQSKRLQAVLAHVNTAINSIAGINPISNA